MQINEKKQRHKTVAESDNNNTVSKPVHKVGYYHQNAPNRKSEQECNKESEKKVADFFEHRGLLLGSLLFCHGFFYFD